MASQIGVTINAITSAKTAYATAETFTIAWGNTQRVFIVPTNHATVNSTAISTAVFLAGTTDFTYGHVRITPQTSHPQLKYLCYTPDALPIVLPAGTDDPNQCNTTALAGGTGAGFRDTTMLTYWGSVIVEANTTGFAMEFIGDMNDSQTLAKGYMSHFSSTNTSAAGVNLN